MTPEQESAFARYKNALARAHKMDAKLEYLDENKYFKASWEAWAEVNELEREFKELVK